MNRMLVLFACVAAVTCNDLQVGSVDNGRVIFDEKIQASPAIWRQVQKITVNASDYEVISRVVVTDERPEKDGDAKIIEGGEGHKNVTVELQSPTVFRGFDFHVIVYAIQDRVDRQHPILISKDTDVNVPNDQRNDESVDVIPEVKPTATTDNEKVSNESNPISQTTDDQTRNYREIEDQSLVDPIVKYVNEDKTVEVPVSVPKNSNEQNSEVTTKSVQESNAPITSAPVMIEEDKDQVIEGSGYVKLSAKGVPQDSKNIDTKVQEISTVKYASTEASDVIVSSADNDQTTQQNFDSISKELGQKVLYGIKKH